LYKIILSSRAEKSYRRLSAINKEIFRRIDNVLVLLKTDPFLGKRLKGKFAGKYSLRVGVYRIIYFVDKKEIIIYILDIAHRREVYN